MVAPHPLDAAAALGAVLGVPGARPVRRPCPRMVAARRGGGRRHGRYRAYRCRAAVARHPGAAVAAATGRRLTGAARRPGGLSVDVNEDAAMASRAASEPGARVAEHSVVVQVAAPPGPLPLQRLQPAATEPSARAATSCCCPGLSRTIRAASCPSSASSTIIAGSMPSSIWAMGMVLWSLDVLDRSTVRLDAVQWRRWAPGWPSSTTKQARVRTPASRWVIESTTRRSACQRSGRIVQRV